jgi:hypothetical protein
VVDELSRTLVHAAARAGAAANMAEASAALRDLSSRVSHEASSILIYRGPCSKRLISALLQAVYTTATRLSGDMAADQVCTFLAEIKSLLQDMDGLPGRERAEISLEPWTVAQQEAHGAAAEDEVVVIQPCDEMCLALLAAASRTLPAMSPEDVHRLGEVLADLRTFNPVWELPPI